MTNSGQNRDGVEVAFEQIALALVEIKTEQMYIFIDVDSFLLSSQQLNFRIKRRRIGSVEIN